MREMELTTLSTEVQDIQKFTKNKRQKKGDFAGNSGDYSLQYTDFGSVNLKSMAHSMLFKV